MILYILFLLLLIILAILFNLLFFISILLFCLTFPFADFIHKNCDDYQNKNTATNYNSY